MKIRVQLYGVLGKKIPEYGSPEGVDIELPDDAVSRDLLKQVKIPETWGVIVTMDSRILKHDDRLRDGAGISVFQAVHGG